MNARTAKKLRKMAGGHKVIEDTQQHMTQLKSRENEKGDNQLIQRAFVKGEAYHVYKNLKKQYYATRNN